MSPAVLCGVSSLEVRSYSVPDGCFEVHVALHQSYIIGKFIMLHVRLLNFIFGKLYHVQSIAAYRATASPNTNHFCMANCHGTNVCHT